MRRILRYLIKEEGAPDNADADNSNFANEIEVYARREGLKEVRSTAVQINALSTEHRSNGDNHDEGPIYKNGITGGKLTRAIIIICILAGLIKSTHGSLRVTHGP